MQILVVCFFFPPSSEPRAVQVSRMLNHGACEIVLACGSDPLAQAGARWDYPARAPFREVLRVPWGSGRRARWAARLQRMDWLPLAGKAPDRFGAWRRPARAAVGRYLAQSDFRPRAVVSFGQPWSSHLLGLDLANRLGLPFIAHFSDLWADSPFVERDPLSRRYAQAKQEAVFRRASRILVPFQALGRELTKNAGPQVQQKLGVINPCFEPGIYPEAGEPPSPERVIRYLGTFYSLRSPAILVHSLAILAGRRPDLLNGVAFELIGDGGESVREAPGFAELPPGLVRFHPQVSYGRSLALMKGADALLNLEAAQTPQFPSKLVDYIGSGRPILGIVPPGLSERTIRELGGWTAHPRDPEGVAAMLADYLAAPSPASPWGGDEVRRGFEAAAVARRFDEIVREAAAGAPTG